MEKINVVVGQLHNKIVEAEMEIDAIYDKLKELQNTGRSTRIILLHNDVNTLKGKIKGYNTAIDCIHAEYIK